LLCFDGSSAPATASSFAGSGGFKTTSVTIPTALKWGSTLVVLDPSNEVAPMVTDHRAKARARHPCPRSEAPEIGVNVLDWIGKHGGTKEEDIASVASWIMSDSGRANGVRDDFFRASGTAAADRAHRRRLPVRSYGRKDQTLRQVRKNLAEPEPRLRERCRRSTRTRNPIS
jgi:type IV secretion system protein VirD4